MRVVLLVALIACGPKPHSDGPSNSAPPSGEVVLYRDHALVRQRVEFEVPPAGYATVRVKIAAGVSADDIVVVERDRFTIRELHVPGDPPPKAKPKPPEEEAEELVDGEVEETPEPPATVKEVELVIGAARAGRFAIHLAYVTERLTWEAAYTMTTTRTRDHVVIRGALAIRNAMGIAMPNVMVRVIDAELGPSIRRAAELLTSTYGGSEPPTTPAASPRDVGRVDLVDGETRVELLPDSRPRPMRSVLVYDPIGTDLDRASASPVRDIALGAGVASTRITESFEVSRDVKAALGLPGGPVRLLERKLDGTLAVLGEARLFDASTRVAEVDTVAVGTAEGVSGHRERREYTYDEQHKRLVEDFVISVDNTRGGPVEVVVREHLYRGQNWTLAYRSAPVAAKEGPQQISMRMIVPAKGQAKLLYVVVYTWP
ncbi:MAG: hypothetical protein M4D80_13935 [Myxococcota bacterium]|nr:hypothetical protein [Myxococcota bacterium]